MTCLVHQKNSILWMLTKNHHTEDILKHLHLILLKHKSRKSDKFKEVLFNNCKIIRILMIKKIRKIKPHSFKSKSYCLWKIMISVNKIFVKRIKLLIMSVLLAILKRNPCWKNHLFKIMKKKNSLNLIFLMFKKYYLSIYQLLKFKNGGSLFYSVEKLKNNLNNLSNKKLLKSKSKFKNLKTKSKDKLKNLLIHLLMKLFNAKINQINETSKINPI